MGEAAANGDGGRGDGTESSGADVLYFRLIIADKSADTIFRVFVVHISAFPAPFPENLNNGWIAKWY
jgi:hypothetical protein